MKYLKFLTTNKKLLSKNYTVLRNFFIRFFSGIKMASSDWEQFLQIRQLIIM